MKKWALMIVFVVMLILSYGQRTGAAQAVYMGQYNDGASAYLLTDTVNIKSYHPYIFTCIVDSDGEYLFYVFFPVNGSPYYKNSEGYEAYVFGGQSPIAARIYRYVVNHW